MVDDRVEADLGQRVAQLGRGAVERPGLSREIGPQIDDRDRVSIGDGSVAPISFNDFRPQNRAFERIEQRQIRGRSRCNRGAIEAVPMQSLSFSPAIVFISYFPSGMARGGSSGKSETYTEATASNRCSGLQWITVR